MLVFVTVATKCALEDIGEFLSPTYAPLMIAPTSGAMDIFPVLAMIMRMIPMVPTVPNDVPNKKETSVLNKKANSMNNPGIIRESPL